MIAQFFLQRPILAWVQAILLLLAGLIALQFLPVAQFPNIAPPQVRVAVNYPGASAQLVESSVTQILEQELKSLNDLLYFEASSNASGEAEILLSFKQQVNAEQAQLAVQNKVNQISYRLPRVVQQQGISVTAAQNSFLMVLVFSDQNQRLSDTDISDWMNSRITDAITRVPGVGNVRVFGSSYAMRIWLKADALQRHGLNPSDIIRAIEQQNTEVPIGELGARPSLENQAINVPITAQARLQTPQQFQQIILKTRSDGSRLYLADVARVEIGSESYGNVSRMNGQPASGMAIMLAPGANAIATADAIKARVEQLKPGFPAGIQASYPEDASRFVKRSLKAVLLTLVEAIVLVVLVICLFLRNWRATLIPLLSLPVVLSASLAVLAGLGMSLNTLSLFAFVLAIGLLVDDAIVVVENTERIMLERQLDAYTATRLAMAEISSALFGIALVLSAVFVPMAFFSGSLGVIYRQFSLTLVTTMALSYWLALSFTPVLCAQLLRRHTVTADSEAVVKTPAYPGLYRLSLARVMRFPLLTCVVSCLLVTGAYLTYQRLPASFIPDDDQGTLMVRYALPAGSSYAQTAALVKQIEAYFMRQENRVVEGIYTVAGFSPSGAGQNGGMAFVNLRDWSVRKADQDSAIAIAQRANAKLSQLVDARVMVMVPPPIDGLGEASGFEFWLLDQQARGRQNLQAASQQVVQQVEQSQRLNYIEAAGGDMTRQLRLQLDQQKALSLGLDLPELYASLSSVWSGTYINDFSHQGQIRKVMLQADASYRSAPEDVFAWSVRNRQGQMVALTSVLSSSWDSAPANLQRFNGAPAQHVSGSLQLGQSSSAFMQALETTVAKQAELGLAWSGLSYQEKISGAQTLQLYVLSIAFVFLCLAAFYESWLIPFAVLLVMPCGVAGAIAGLAWSGWPKDIYFQVGMLTTLGLTAKNAILIVEYCQQLAQSGLPLLQAVQQAAQQRVRPVLMTSLAFAVGILPLLFATGPGSSAQKVIGVSVLGGVISATLFTLYLVPGVYYLLARWRLALSQRQPDPATPLLAE